MILPLVASIGVTLLSLVGGIFLSQKQRTGIVLSGQVLSFAAGIMLSVALLDLLPEALHSADHESTTPFYGILFGIVTFFLLERFLIWFHHHDDTHHAHPQTYLVLLGDALHNAIDGVAIGAAFITDIRLGWITTLAIALHEIPQELADISILIHGGIARRKALLLNLLSGIPAIIAAIGAYWFLPVFSTLLPFILSYTAGMFLYIACSDLIPELHRDFRKQHPLQHAIPFLLGLGVMIVLVTFIGHAE